MSPPLRVSALALLALALLAARSDAADESKDTPRDKASWLLSSDEELPDPPIVRARAGVVLWPYLRTSITVGRKGSLPGRDLENIEDTEGLPGRWFSPFFEATVGTQFRGGVGVLDLDRRGDFVRSDQTVDVGAGRVFAQPGDFVSFGFHYTQVDLFAQWDVFRSARLRIGLIGGARGLRLATRIAGVQPNTQNYQSIALNDWIISPLVGGQVEIEPVSSFTVYTSIRFIDWAWHAIGLRDQRAFEFQIGCAVEFIEDVLSAGLDFRFLSVSVNPTDLNGGKNIADYSLDAGGLGFSLSFKY